MKKKLNSFQSAERLKLLVAGKDLKQSIFHRFVNEFDAVCTRIKRKITINLNLDVMYMNTIAGRFKSMEREANLS